MKDIFMFCDSSPECVCEDICCQECPKLSSCEKRCKMVRYKERIYSSDEFLAQQLDELAEKMDNWLIAVAAERIRSGFSNTHSKGTADSAGFAL